MLFFLSDKFIKLTGTWSHSHLKQETGITVALENSAFKRQIVAYDGVTDNSPSNSLFTRSSLPVSGRGPFPHIYQ